MVVRVEVVRTNPGEVLVQDQVDRHWEAVHRVRRSLDKVRSQGTDLDLEEAEEVPADIRPLHPGALPVVWHSQLVRLLRLPAAVLVGEAEDRTFLVEEEDTVACEEIRCRRDILDTEHSLVDRKVLAVHKAAVRRAEEDDRQACDRMWAGDVVLDTVVDRKPDLVDTLAVRIRFDRAAGFDWHLEEEVEASDYIEKLMQL